MRYPSFCQSFLSGPNVVNKFNNVLGPVYFFVSFSSSCSHRLMKLDGHPSRLLLNSTHPSLILRCTFPSASSLIDRSSNQLRPQSYQGQVIALHQHSTRQEVHCVSSYRESTPPSTTIWPPPQAYVRLFCQHLACSFLDATRGRPCPATYRAASDVLATREMWSENEERSFCSTHSSRCCRDEEVVPCEDIGNGGFLRQVTCPRDTTTCYLPQERRVCGWVFLAHLPRLST